MGSAVSTSRATYLYSYEGFLERTTYGGDGDFMSDGGLL